MNSKELMAVKMKNVAENIRLIREGKNFTQEYMAMKLGLSQNAFSKIELGYTKLTVERLYHIADLLGTDAIALLTFKKANADL